MSGVLFLRELFMKFIKAFNRKEYAEAFISGNFHLCPLADFRNMKDQRADLHEGRLDYFMAVDPPTAIQTINSIDGESKVVLTGSAVAEGYLQNGDLLHIEIPAAFHQFSFGIFDHEMSQAMKERYAGFGNCWVIGNLEELINALLRIPNWVCYYKVNYSDTLVGFGIKPLKYQYEREIKVLFKFADSKNPITIQTLPLGSAKLEYYTTENKPEEN